MKNFIFFLFLLFEFVNVFSQNPVVFMEKREGRRYFGLKDSASSEVLVPAIWKEIHTYDFSSYMYGIGYLVEGQGISWGLFNKYGNEIYVIRNGSILSQQKSPKSFVVHDRDRKQTALIDTMGNYMIPFQDNHIKSIGELLCMGREQRRILTSTAQPLFPFTVEECYGNHHWLKVKKEGKYGLLHPQGGIIIPIQMDDLRVYMDSLVYTRKDYRSTLYNLEGEPVLGPYEQIRMEERYSRILVRNSDKWGIYSFSGEEIVPPLYPFMQVLTTRYGRTVLKVALTREKNMYKYDLDDFGIIDTDGETIISPHSHYSEIEWVNGVYIVRQVSRVGIFTFAGDTVLPVEPRYVRLTANRAGIIIGKGTGHTREDYIHDCGIISTKNTDTLIPFEYGFLFPLNGQLVAAKKDGKYFAINMFTNQRVNENEYKGYLPREYYPNSGHSLVYNGKRKKGLVNLNWEEVVPPKYKRIELYDVGGKNGEKFQKIYTFKKKYGLLSVEGRMILPIEYDRIAYQINDSITATREDIEYIFDLEGNLLDSRIKSD